MNSEHAVTVEVNRILYCISCILVTIIVSSSFSFMMHAKKLCHGAIEVGVHDSLRSLKYIGVQDSLENSEWGCRILMIQGISYSLKGYKIS